MDTRGLRYFQAVAEFGSYSRGAEFLRISQPAVSRQIRALEQELGRPLFIRHSHGVNLTDAGRMLLERGQAILRQFDQARDDISRGLAGPSGTVTLAVPIEAVRQAITGPRKLGPGGDSDDPVVIVDGVTGKPVVGALDAATIWVKELPA